MKQDVDESVAIDRLASPVEHEVSIRGIYAGEEPQAGHREDGRRVR